MTSRLRTVEERLPAGFRFHPRDDELVCDYLLKFLASANPDLLIQVDLNHCEPWDLPESARLGGNEWYFYSQRDRKYSTGLRTNRATVSGYWKATGKDRPVFRQALLVGMRKTLVFYQGRAPKGRKTEWVMHEFRLDTPVDSGAPPEAEDWVLCRVLYKKGSTESAGGSNSMEAMFGLSDNQHVPCFSIFRPNQAFPTFIDHSSLGDYRPIGIYNPNSPSSWNNYGNKSSGDEEMIRAAWNNHLMMMSKMGSDNNGLVMKGFPSYGEGSSDSAAYVSMLKYS